MTSKKKILITGATGFIGKYLIEHAIKNNYDVFLTLRKSSNTKEIDHLDFNKIHIDFTSEKTISNSLSDTIIFDTIIHNAGVKACFKKEDYFKYNETLTENLSTVLKKRKLLKGKFIYISSLAALGPGDHKTLEDITENKVEQPISNYGRSKLFAEKKVINSGLNYIILRPTAVYGKGTSDYKDLIAIVKKQLAVYTASPNQLLSFIHANDVAQAVFLASESSKNNTTYNLSDTREYTLKSVYKTVADELNTNLKLKIRIPLFAIYSVAVINHYLEAFFKIENSLNSIEKAKEITALNWKCSAKKLKEELNFKPLHSLKEIVD